MSKFSELVSKYSQLAVELEDVLVEIAVASGEPIEKIEKITDHVLEGIKKTVMEEVVTQREAMS